MRRIPGRPGVDLYGLCLGQLHLNQILHPVVSLLFPVRGGEDQSFANLKIYQAEHPVIWPDWATIGLSF